MENLGNLGKFFIFFKEYFSEQNTGKHFSFTCFTFVFYLYGVRVSYKTREFHIENTALTLNKCPFSKTKGVLI